MFDLFNLIIDFFKDIGIICDQIDEISNNEEKLPPKLNEKLDEYPPSTGGSCTMWTIPIKVEMDANDFNLESPGE